MCSHGPLVTGMIYFGKVLARFPGGSGAQRANTSTCNRLQKSNKIDVLAMRAAPFIALRDGVDALPIGNEVPWVAE